MNGSNNQLLRLQFRTTKAAVMILGLLAASLFTTRLQADDRIEQTVIDRAHNFLKSANRGRDILSCIHFGAAYQGHTVEPRVREVQNRPGHFAVVYRFDWECNGKGKTDVAFFCDAKGNFYGVRVLWTDAVIQQPFVFANASIALVGNAVLAAFRDQMTPNQIQQAQQFINNADAKGLLEISLTLQQALGQ